MEWIHAKAKNDPELDGSRIAIGGTSAGANLSCVAALKTAASENPIPLLFQLLIVPVVDNTAVVETIWAKNQNAPWLTPKRMLWYRRMYLPNQDDWKNWDASPNLAPNELLSKMPPTLMAISEQDLLAPEALRFAEQLQSLGVRVETDILEGSTHSILALNG